MSVHRIEPAGPHKIVAVPVGLPGKEGPTGPTGDLDTALGAGDLGQYPTPDGVGGYEWQSKDVLDVRDFGAVGDGVADDTDAIQAALTAAETGDGAVVQFPADRVYRLTEPLSFVVNASAKVADVVWQADGCVFEWHGLNDQVMIDVSADSSAANKGRFDIVGGRFRNPVAATGVTAIRYRDMPARMRFSRMDGFERGVMLENWGAWCEQSQLHGVSINAERHALYFSDGADSGGPSGTTSFARTRLIGCNFSGGEAGFGLVRVTGNLYHSLVIGVTGNLASGVHMFQCDGSVNFNGSMVMYGGIEGQGTMDWFHETTPGGIATFPWIASLDAIGSNTQLTNAAGGALSFPHRIDGQVMIGDGPQPSGADWQIALKSELEVVSDRVGGGFRVSWMTLTSNNELRLGSTIAGREPDAVRIGGQFDRAPLIMNGHYLWVDSSGALRISATAPTSDTDGTVVGTQS